jgi:esterase/lipase superfamily enzyme
MLARILALVLVLGTGAGLANGQSAASPGARPGAPGPCSVTPQEGLAALQQRKERLQRKVAAEEARQPAGAVPKTLTKAQAALLDVVFQIRCVEMRQPSAGALREIALPVDQVGGSASVDAPKAARTRSPVVIPPQPAPAAPATRGAPRNDAATAGSGPTKVIEVTTYFATNRGRSGKTEPARFYDAKIAPLSYGRALVTIPAEHTPGRLEQPSIWRLELQPDPAKHFVLTSVATLATDAARAEMARKLAASSSKAILVFVHGYNMSFAESAMRTAQLAYDLEFQGMPFFFSWPSAGQVTGYLRDGETAELSEGAFDRVLDDLSALPGAEIYVIAHSMGSRIASKVLKSRVERSKSTARVRELLLAAPDINADLFADVIAPKLKELQATQVTLYAASSDLALIASKAVNGYRRVGETTGGVLVYPGLETIDASRAAIALREFGHSYLTDSATVLSDIKSLLLLKVSAKQRGLPATGTDPNVYWSLQ